MNYIIDDYINQTRKKFPFLPEEGLNFLANQFEVREYKAKEYFIKANNKFPFIGFIHSGLIRVYFYDKQDNEVTFNFLKEGDYATHYVAFKEETNSRFNFQCIENSVILLISKESINKITEKYFEFEKFRRIIIEEFLAIFFKRFEGMLIESAEERYLNFVKEKPFLLKRVLITHLCSYLGVTRQTLTRIRNNLVKN